MITLFPNKCQSANFAANPSLKLVPSIKTKKVVAVGSNVLDINPSLSSYYYNLSTRYHFSCRSKLTRHFLRVNIRNKGHRQLLQ